MYSEHKPLIELLKLIYIEVEELDEGALADILTTTNNWIKIEDNFSNEIGLEMLENREWERSDARMCLVRMYKIIEDDNWKIKIRNYLRVYENPNLYHYHELDSEIPISNCEIVGGRKAFPDMLYTYDSQTNKYYPL